MFSALWVAWHIQFMTAMSTLRAGAYRTVLATVWPLGVQHVDAVCMIMSAFVLAESDTYPCWVV